MSEKRLTERIKKLGMTWGADMVGIAPVERFHSAPRMSHPTAILPDAKSVIVLAVRYPKGTTDNWGKPPAESMYLFQSVQSAMTGVVTPMIQHQIVRMLEEAGHLAVPVGGSSYWRYRDYKEVKGGYFADFSHRHAAVAAGLGEFGRQGLLVTPRFGTRQRLTSIISNAPLTPDRLYSGKPICNGCMKCVKACPVAALSKKRMAAIAIGDKECEYCLVDKWRCAWVEQLGMIPESGLGFTGLTTNARPPKTVTREKFLAVLKERDGFHVLSAAWGAYCGRCLRACPVDGR